MPKRSAYQRHLSRSAAPKLKALECVRNPYPGRDYEIRFEIPEFNCVCPKTGLPDFATIRIWYWPDQDIVELKALKLYINSFRNIGIFHEAVANRILDDLVKVAAPKKARLEADFNVRGGIHTVVETRFNW